MPVDHDNHVREDREDRDAVFDRFVREVEMQCKTMIRTPPGSLKMHAMITKFFVVFGRELNGMSLACHGDETGDDELKLELHDSKTSQIASITIRSTRLLCCLPIWRWGVASVEPFGPLTVD